MTVGKKRDLLYGDRPSHKHRDADGNEWLCNSGYCEDVTYNFNNGRDVHPDDGGPAPIIQGREPWRGR